VPFTGGWAVFAGFWSGLLLAYLLVPELEAEWRLWLPGFFLAHLMIFTGGLIDDFVELSAWVKLLIQISATLVLISYGLRIDTIYVPFTGSFLIGDLSYPVTILWVLLIVNAVNVIDGLDGLAGGLGLITALGLLYTGIVLQVPVVAVFSVILIAVLIGFLPFNFPRAALFLGDSGSQSLGFVFAVVAIYCPIKSYTVVAMFVPLLALGVPLLELATSFLRRLLSGRSVVKADRGHLYDLLLVRVRSSARAVGIFCGAALALQVFLFALFLFDRRIVFSILVAFMLMTAAWFWRLTRQEDH
jgi:UDP-GlcNAc:undecaprenyl-phosphate GlcNAc-1-phosphate transferase